MALITSKHLKTATELTLVADIRQEFAWTEGNEVVSYATRLTLMLKTFFELRRAATEQSAIASVGALERLRSLYNFTWSIFDGGNKLLLSVTFDRPWEPYIRAIVDQAGPLLDAIFCHCEGYPGHSTEDGYVAFASWVRDKQIEASLFYAADPDLTVDDQRYLKEFERRYAESAVAPRFEQEAARLAVADPSSPDAGALLFGAGDPRAQVHAALARMQRSAGAVLALSQYFHVPTPEVLELTAPGKGAALRPEIERERRYFDRAGWLLLAPIMSKRLVALLRPELRAALASMESQSRVGERAEPAAPPEERLAHNVQGNILRSYKSMTHGAVVLLGFDSSEVAKQFLSSILPEVTRDEAAEKATTGVNVALTFNGLRTLGLSELELQRFPREFQEGMRERAGLLGDVADEHPANWTEPRQLAQGAARSEPKLLSLESVDLLLMVQVQDVSRAEPSKDDLGWAPGHPAWQRVTELVGTSLGVRVLHVQTLRREYVPGTDLVKERFGFADGISQPLPNFRPEAKQNELDAVNLGELLLGHPNDRGEAYPPGATAGSAELKAGVAQAADAEARYVEQLCTDGSFLVVRKLEQDVEAFEQFVLENANQFTGGRGGAEELYAKLMGRYKDGTPLTAEAHAAWQRDKKPNAMGLNQFDYQKDPAGESCPLASHVRRTNPRTPAPLSVHGLPLRLPRLLRRGFSYGPLPGSESKQPRGLMFMAYNASIAEQFEVIQRWINGGNSTGLASSHKDPIVSHACPAVISVIDAGEPRHLLKKKPFVSLKWGLYLFAPSIDALEALAHRSVESHARAAAQAGALAAKKGAEIIRKLQLLEALEAGRHASAPSAPSARQLWKQLLEDRGAREEARALWAAIREQGGALRTAYGVLVASSDGVRQVLSDESSFSVREYWHRMRDSVGELYLGMDRCPVKHPEPGRPKDAEYEAAVGPSTYDETSTAPNAFMYGLDRRASFQLARREAQRVFAELVRADPDQPNAIVSLRDFAIGVVSSLSKAWFGLPLDPAQFQAFQAAALAIFYPHPSAAVRASIQLNRPRVERAAEEASAAGSELGTYLAEHQFRGSIPAALIGGTQGFLAATVGSFLSVAHQWLEGERVARLRRWLLSNEGETWLAAQVPAVSGGAPERCAEAKLPAEVASLIELEFWAALGRAPVPDLLHRTAVREVKLGAVTVQPSETVVVSIASALSEKPLHPGSVASALSETPSPLDLLFGGTYSGSKEQGTFVHACPGKAAALGAILGMLVELIRTDPRREGILRVSVRDA